MPDLDAAKLLALAERAEAQSVRARAHWYGDNPPAVFSVMPDGEWHIDPPAEAAMYKATMRATLCAEVRGSALVQALLASTVDPADCICGGTGHDLVGDPCDGKHGDGCLTDEAARAELVMREAMSAGARS